MIQQIIAFIVIAFFLARLLWQKQKRQIGAGEFIFWLLFWFLAGVAMFFIKQIDKLAAVLGFSASGIDILLYIGVILLFYLVFRLRIKIEKIDNNITKIIRKIAINNSKK